MRAAASDPAPCRTVRGLAASRRPFGDARSLVRHGAGVEPPPRHQAIQSKKEVLTFNRDLTGRRWNAVPTAAPHGRAAVPSAAVSTRAAKMAALPYGAAAW